jgi:hypothetical protein
MNPVQPIPPYPLAAVPGANTGSVAAPSVANIPATFCVPDGTSPGPYPNPADGWASGASTGGQGGFYGVIQTLIDRLGSIIDQALGGGGTSAPGFGSGTPDPATGTIAGSGPDAPAPGRVYIE